MKILYFLLRNNYYKLNAQFIINCNYYSLQRHVPSHIFHCFYLLRRSRELLQYNIIIPNVFV